MNYIDVKVTSVMAISSKEYLVSSNEGYALRFFFDEKWKKEKHKTARILFDGRYTDIPIKKDIAILPKIPPCESLNVGVYSKHYATTYADIGCILSSKDKKFTKFKKGDYFV